MKRFCEFMILYLPYMILKYHEETFGEISLDFVKNKISKKLSK